MADDLREAMPAVTALVDDLRAAFGREAIDRIIVRGLRGEENAFFAREGGHTLGRPFTWPAGIKAEAMVLEPWPPPQEPPRGKP